MTSLTNSNKISDRKIIIIIQIVLARFSFHAFQAIALLGRMECTMFEGCHSGFPLLYVSGAFRDTRLSGERGKIRTWFMITTTA